MPPRARRGCDQRVTSRACKCTRPDDGGSSPASTLTSVDLPAPFVPMTACTSPRTSVSDTRSTAVSPPKRREMFDAVSRMSSSMGDDRAKAAQLRGQARYAVRHQRDACDDREAERQLPMARERPEQ